jgi:hypothetical protein
LPSALDWLGHRHPPVHAIIDAEATEIQDQTTREWKGTTLSTLTSVIFIVKALHNLRTPGNDSEERQGVRR